MSSVKTQSLGALVLGPDGETLAARAAQAGVAALPPAENHHAGRIFDIEVDGERHIGLALLDASQQTILLRRAAAGAALFDFLGAVPFADAILEHFLTNPYQAITVVDHTGCIRFISPVHEAFFGLRTGEGTGRPAEQVIPNSRLGHVAATGKAEIGQLQRMNGVTRVVNRVPIVADGKTVGAIGQVLFKEPEAIGRMHKEVEELRSQLAHYRRELHGLRQRDSGVGLLIGESAPMQRLRREIETVARLDVPVLVLGESGTGKELVARAIHSAGRGSHGVQGDDEGTQAAPLVSLNLAAFPATLIEAELFGHAAGAFTGSHRHGQPGKLEQAAGGTLFLDEVAELPLAMQVKLLRAIQEKSIRPVGANAEVNVDVRILSATHKNLAALTEDGRFRHDLYYRINVIELRVPPLRERLEDLPGLAQRVLNRLAGAQGRPVPTLSAAALDALRAHPFPGNVRELENVLERALAMADDDRIEASDLRLPQPQSTVAAAIAAGHSPVFGAPPSTLAHAPASAPPPTNPRATGTHAAFDPRQLGSRETASSRLPEYIEQMERQAIEQALQENRFNKTRTAAALGITFRALRYKLKKLGID
jgi:transcriptional regulator with PAS, ATPase and Fis domain